MRRLSVSLCETTSYPMDNEPINLLPAERRRVLSREYLIRVAVTVTFLVTLLIVTAGALLVPTYIFLTQSASAKQAQLANVESILSSANEKSLSARLVMLAEETARLSSLGTTPSASATIRVVLATARPGVTLSGFGYTRAGDKTSGILTVSGIATTRDALRSYQLALQSSSFAAAVNLPVSAYAKDTNIEFTITVTLTP